MRVDQKTYWNSNLDPGNLGRKRKARDSAQPPALARELPFHLTPDQQLVLEQFSPLPGKRILEIGAGLGINARHMAEQGAVVVATDIAHERLAQVSAHHAQDSRVGAAGRLYLVRAAAEALPFREDSFDHVFSKAVIIHTRVEEAVPELHRVLKAEGNGAFVEPLQRNPLVNAYRATLAPRIWRSITRYFGPTEVDVVHRTFPRVEDHRFYLLAFLAFGWQFGLRSAPMFRLFLPLLHGIDHTLFRAMPGLRQRAWFTVLSVWKKP